MFAFCLGVIDSYADRHEEDPNNTIYSSEVSVTSGGQATLTVSMKNSVEIGGFEFDLYLPEGFTVDHSIDSFGEVAINASLIEKRTDLSRHTFQASFPSKDDHSHIKVLCYSSASKSFLDNDGAVATIVVNVAESVEEGDYTVDYKNVVISNATDTYATAKITSTISVGEDAPVYDEGYAITLAPFDIEPGQEYDEDIENTEDNKVIVFKMQNAAEVSKVEFDVELPESLSVGQIVVKKKYYDDVYFAGDYESENDFPEIDDNDDGSKHLTAENNFSAVEKAAPIIKFAITSEENVPAGVYTINIKNVEITATDGTVYKNIAPTTSYVKVGTPKEQTIALEGMLTEEIDKALANENSISTLDLTNVTQIEKTLTLVDGRSFIGPKKPVLAPEASYSRAMTNQWGTIMLPYEVESNNEVAYYLPSSIEDGTLKLTKQETLPANTPALVSKLSGEGIAAVNTNVKVSSKDGNTHATGNVVMHGSFTNDTKVNDPNAYYIKSNKFWLCNEYFFIDAFRAYFTVESASAKSLSIDVDDVVDSINVLVGVGDTTIEGYYDVTGKRLTNLQNGLNIVKFSNGKTKKIIVE